MFVLLAIKGRHNQTLGKEKLIGRYRQAVKGRGKTSEKITKVEKKGG